VIRYHRMKTHVGPFGEVWEGRKVHEFRRDDRDPKYEVGDEVSLIEWNPDAERATGREVAVIITYVSRSTMFGLPAGYCVFSFVVSHRSRWARRYRPPKPPKVRWS